MTDHNNNDNTTGRTQGRRQRPRWILMGIAGALALVIGGMTWSAVAYSGKSWDSDKIERFVEWKIDDMLAEVDATDDQRTQVHAIATAAIADMGEFHNFKHEGRQALVAALTKETVDREALETLRQSKLETADRASQRLLTALADAAEVLTPRPAQGAGGGVGIAPLASRARLSAPAPDGAEGAEGAVRPLPPRGVRPRNRGHGRRRPAPSRPAPPSRHFEIR